ncbi:hypothetical protein IWQ62_000963 [Dispira parvispora]|uniref:Uncharacterized protein n=1 Tax=Dispira parvispora TaxID=1520584 RepID=A0A9W8AZ29_9FUNG|nr:hypothetical protein IWQ62_000963 [Dispira parvispora]
MYKHSLLLFRIGDPLLLTTDTVYRLFQPVIAASDEALTVVLDSPSFGNNVVNNAINTTLGWDAMQRFLALLYSVASQCAAEGNKYLFQTDILLVPPTRLETCEWLHSVNAVFLPESGPSMLSTKKYAQYMESLQQRTTRVQTFLNKLNPDRVYKVWQLSDPFGPTITEKEIGALVCSEETLGGGRAVNREREVRGFPPLELKVITVISHPPSTPTELSSTSQSAVGDPFHLKLSSTAIRKYYALREQSGSPSTQTGH